jgi:hypothetical protein
MVDLNDFIHKKTTRHGKLVQQKLYKHTCDNCGASRGYQAKNFKTPGCNKCSHAGKVLTTETKERMSIAATRRYNDPNWKPKESSSPFVGQRRTVYVRQTTPLQRKIRHRTKTLLWQKLINHSVNKAGSTCWFSYTSTDDQGFKDSWALENLQPMWYDENRSKGARYTGDFQSEVK